MADSESTQNPDNRNHLTRRAALRGTAAAAAVVLPAGVAVAATGSTGPDADPGLAQLEAGYRRWQALMAERDGLRGQRDALEARAESAVRPLLPPEPPIPPELEPYAHWNEGLGQIIVWFGTVPSKGKISKIGDAHMAAEIEWRHAHNALLAQHPDDQAAGELDAEAEKVLDQAYDLRDELLKIPARSPRALLIKAAISIEAERLEDIEAAMDRSDFTDDLRLILTDLRAMAEVGVA